MIPRASERPRPHGGARRVLLPVVLAAFVLPAQARDGVTEINQAAALAGGVTAGDAAGFPVTIDTAGSYLLTGDLTVPDENTVAIAVLASADQVTIDMNGHAILGVVVCSGAPVTSCSASGTGYGIFSSAEQTTILNGKIRGMGSDGILVNHHGRIDGVTVENNAAHGIDCAGFCMVSRSVAVANGGIGMTAALGPIRDSVARHNGSTGIAADVCTIANNSASDNLGDGIQAGSDSVVVGNTLTGNGNYGLSTDLGTGYARNVISGNTVGTVTGGGVETGANLCDGSTTCP